jgi:hypothetical protein
MTGPEFVATVVVCEDDRVTLDLLCDRLASDRFEPLPAGTAEEALRLCRHRRPDILVVDRCLLALAGPRPSGGGPAVSGRGDLPPGDRRRRSPGRRGASDLPPALDARAWSAYLRAPSRSAQRRLPPLRRTAS